MTKRTAVLSAILALAFIGIADSWYLTEHAMDGTALSCGIAGLDGCNTVAQSPYSRFMGIPLAVYGMVFYIFVFVFAALMLTNDNPLLRRLLRFVVGVSAVLSVVFVGIQIFLIQALCVYCLLSALLSFGLFWLTLRLCRDGFKALEPVVVPWGK